VRLGLKKVLCVAMLDVPCAPYAAGATAHITPSKWDDGRSSDLQDERGAQLSRSFELARV
jgi:hypothetical protein